MGFVAEHPQADRLQEASAHFVRIAVDLYFSSVFKFPIAHMVAVVVIVVHRGGKVPVYAEGEGAGTEVLAPLTFRRYCVPEVKLRVIEKLFPRTAVVVGDQER